jgi:hypothetical protein
MEENANKSIEIIDDKLGRAFLKAKEDQKVLEGHAVRMNFEMPITTKLNEQIALLKSKMQEAEIKYAIDSETSKYNMIEIDETGLISTNLEGFKNPKWAVSAVKLFDSKGNEL